MRIYGFQGIRYRGDAPSVGATAAPPYDQIDDALRDELHGDERQFAHLSRPRGDSPAAGHDRAATVHERWLEEGVLQIDPEPSLYPYVIVLPDGARRLGLCALVGVEGEDSPVIRRHEHTVSKTVEERLALLHRTAVDLEPILLLSEDDGDLDTELATDLAERQPVAEHTDASGNRHLLYRLAGAERIGRYRELFEACSGLIADGHHRYKVSRLFAAETGADVGAGAAAKLAVITSLRSPTLTIDPIHRGLRGDYDLGALASAARVRWSGESGTDLAAAVASAPAPALGVWTDGGAEIWQLDVSGESRYPVAASDLTVLALHEHVFPALGLTDDDATNGTVLYRSDPDKLMAELAAGDLDVGLWLPPMSSDLFAAAISDGDVLPPKSTRFLPKVVSGLVWSAHAGDLL